MSQEILDLIENNPESTETAIIDIYLKELDKAYKKIEELYHFIEMTEALTYDQATSKRIHSFLKEEGIWPPEN